MINKRLLIKNLLAHNDENSFYDKKRFIDIGQQEGKAKFLKHVCALANSNPDNHSYIVLGVEDEDNAISGVDFFDDSKIQNLINAYLENPPAITYENVNFPNLPEGKVVGLVTIRSSGKICSLRKNIWKYYGGTVFFREGSISKPKIFDIELTDHNSTLVSEIEQYARNNIALTLDGVIDFIHIRHKDLTSSYRVFKEQFVVCWSGIRKVVKDQEYFSRVDIELINEQVKLFYSASDEVTIHFDEEAFFIEEYVYLGLGDQKRYYSLERVGIHFEDNGSYHIRTRLVFEPPQYEKRTLFHEFNAHKALLLKVKQNFPLSSEEKRDLQRTADTLLICYLNGIDQAEELMQETRQWLKQKDLKSYNLLKEAMRVLRKVRYN